VCVRGTRGDKSEPNQEELGNRGEVLFDSYALILLTRRRGGEGWMIQGLAL